MILKQWDMISFPPHLYRGLENVSRTNSWLFAVLDPHDVYRFKDPLWSQNVLDQAGSHGFRADERGKMVKPDNYDEVHARMLSKLTKSMKASDAAKAKPKKSVSPSKATKTTKAKRKTAKRT